MAEITITEEDARVVQELITVARHLKAGGYLSLITELTTNGDLLLEHLANERAAIRGLGLLEAVTDPIKNMPPQDMPRVRHHLVQLVGSLLHAMADTNPKEAPRVGMLGALKYLNDPQVQKGLGFLLALAKNLGKALEEYEPR